MEHQSQTDLDIPCEQSGESEGEGARKSSHTEMEDGPLTSLVSMVGKIDFALTLSSFRQVAKKIDFPVG